MKKSIANAELLKTFIVAFGILDDLVVYDSNQCLAPELDAGHDDSPWAHQLWKPASVSTPRSELLSFCASIHAEFPPLYEQLVLSYRWLEVDLNGFVRLFANPTGKLSEGLLSQIESDRIHSQILLPAGLVPFGRAEESFDSVCFDTTRQNREGDCPIVRVEHEALLCNGRIGDRQDVAESFEHLVKKVICMVNER